MKKNIVTLIVGLLLASNSIAAVEPAREVPDCWTLREEHPIKEAYYSIFFDPDLVDKATLLKMLDRAGQFWHMISTYPSFASNCGEVGEKSNCIDISATLSRAELNDIRDGLVDRAWVREGVERSLTRFLNEFPWVEISCVPPDGICGLD